MGLRGFILKRLGYSIILIVLALSLNYFLFMMLGNPEELFVPARGLTQQEQERFLMSFKRAWGLDQPFHIRYLDYLRKMFTWDFGRSMVNDRPVADQIMGRLPWTLLLIGASTVISIVIGVLTGVLSAYKRGTQLDSGILLTALMLGSLPTFWLGMVLVVIFGEHHLLGMFPEQGSLPIRWGVGSTPFPQAFTIVGGTLQVDPSGALTYLGGILSHAILPVLTLSMFLFGGYTLLARATMLESLTEDYIVTARAKGVSETTVLFRHALKNASLPLITSVALAFGFLFSGAAITETVFNYGGLGLWIFESVTNIDFFAIQAIFYIITLMVVIANIVADLLYGMVDPRIKYG
jgi:peptide/nickel transport system permease protein